MVLLRAMNSKKIRLATAFFVVIICVVLVFLNRQNYQLNRTVRDISSRLDQITVFSRTRAVEYRVIFYKDFYVINVFDQATGQFTKFQECAYRTGVISESIGVELIFAGGRYQGYSLEKKRKKAPRYMVLNFHLTDSGKRKGIIFYRGGDWRVLG